MINVEIGETVTAEQPSVLVSKENWLDKQTIITNQQEHITTLGARIETLEGKL